MTTDSPKMSPHEVESHKKAVHDLYFAAFIFAALNIVGKFAVTMGYADPREKIRQGLEAIAANVPEGRTRDMLKRFLAFLVDCSLAISVILIAVAILMQQKIVEHIEHGN